MKKNKPIYKTMKVFDCEDMPDKIRKVFFSKKENFEDHSYSSHYVSDPLPDKTNHDDNLINDWFVNNGSKRKELVLIYLKWICDPSS